MFYVNFLKKTSSFLTESQFNIIFLAFISIEHNMHHKGCSQLPLKLGTDLMEQLPAEVPSQQAVQRLLVPAKSHPAEMLLEAELGPLQPWLR